MIEEKNSGRAGFGQERLIVRGRSFLDLATARELRPRYNEYPERVALDAGFPQPGRRGPSRPASGGGSGAGGVSGGGGGAGGSGGAGGGVGIPVYPPPRERPGYPGSGGGVEGGATPAVSPGCGVPRGNFMVRSVIGLAAGTTNVGALRGGSGRARIIELHYWADNVLPLIAVTAAVKVSDDSDVSGGFATTGVRVREVSAAFDVNPFAERQIFYPSFIIPFTGSWFFKVIVDNQTAGVVNAVIGMSYEYI